MPGCSKLSPPSVCAPPSTHGKVTRQRAPGRPQKKMDIKKWTRFSDAPFFKHTHLSKHKPKYNPPPTPPLQLSRKGVVTLSRMKSSRYLVISYFWAPRLPLRSKATGERETEKEKKRERETGPRPITSPVRVTGDRGRGNQAMGGKKRTDLCFRPARLTSLLSFLSLSWLTLWLLASFFLCRHLSFPCPLSIFLPPPPFPLHWSLSLSPLFFPPPPLARLPFKHSSS